MEQVTINTSVNVKDGPLVKITGQLGSDAYVVASLALAKGASGNVAIMPPTGIASLMVIQATKDKDQANAKVEVTPEGTAAGTKLALEGSLVVTNAAVLAGLAAGGPQKLTVKNVDADDATVSILVAFDS
jgi:hypothetical protein